MDALLQSIAVRREQLDRLRPFSPEALANLEHYYDIELTYTSNAIEGNTLSPVETTLVIEQGVTIVKMAQGKGTRREGLPDALATIAERLGNGSSG